MSEQQEESEDRSYIQDNDVVLIYRGRFYDIGRVIQKSTNADNALYIQSLINSYSAYDAHIDNISLLIPKESLLFQYKMEGDMFMAYNDGQLVMNMHCPTNFAHVQTKHYAIQMSNIYALKQLKETCKNKIVLELIKDRKL
jgi:hypothetical protein